ncbi:GNAT family N-acetyltransferase [Tumebacillus sp. ITR2]|uniref:GNAT family N-acetyltransferase n=1 Tax=Tumebacillus amylolyticus TaxID=2801339 RepID=A0ABS1J6B0_9BACL|nr:GNAT family N-acetyltransferase [Tumebacillus amylolyticus]MBL0385799.1 GNAT family N-acetyltransferase [Tumebacillus amylolyticus]
MTERKQPLYMLFPESLLSYPPEVSVPQGYLLRPYRDEDASALTTLLAEEGWNLEEAKFLDFLNHCLPDGLFVVVERESGTLVATGSALHNPQGGHFRFPFGGSIGYVVVHPDHRGKKLGELVSAVALRRLIRGGYRTIWTGMEDHRLPAIKTYLKLRFVPFLYAPEMEERWHHVHIQLNLPSRTQEWAQELQQKKPPQNQEAFHV